MNRQCSDGADTHNDKQQDKDLVSLHLSSPSGTNRTHARRTRYAALWVVVHNERAGQIVWGGARSDAEVREAKRRAEAACEINAPLSPGGEILILAVGTPKWR